MLLNEQATSIGVQKMSEPREKQGEIRQLYLSLMKKCLTNLIYIDNEYQSASMRGYFKQTLAKILNKFDLRVMKKAKRGSRIEGRDWPEFAHSMAGIKRLDSLQECVEEVLDKNIAGDFIETGVWRGGASILMKAVLNAHGITDRTIYVADSFQGLPPPTNDVDRQPSTANLYKDKRLAVSLEEVKENFKAYDLYDDRIEFVKGWFSETLPKLTASSFSLVRLDGDMYQSTMDGLVNLYPKLSKGGFLIIDDYDISACKQAVTEYRQKNNITEPIHTIDWTGVFWRKSL